MKTLIAFAGALSALALAPAAAAAPDGQITIQHEDLNLASAKGQKQLERRIDRAARQACAYGNTSTGTRIRDHVAYDCYVAAKASAMQHMASLVRSQALGG